MKTKVLFLSMMLGALCLVGCQKDDEPNNNGNGGQVVNGIPVDSFSVSSSLKVQFSQGNLQYQASTQTWRFAENQWDVIGTDNENISDEYDGWIDLFGWGTGKNPTNTSPSSSDYSNFTDWGANKISNGGNVANQWRTLTKDEWVYLFEGRTNAKKLYGFGRVNKVNGVIILPDAWVTPSSLIFTASANNDNTYSASEWSEMEQAGAVFLPVTGRRYETSVYDVGSHGYYWSSTSNGGSSAYYVDFDSYDLDPQVNSFRLDGRSVRLVR